MRNRVAALQDKIRRDKRKLRKIARGLKSVKKVLGTAKKRNPFLRAAGSVRIGPMTNGEIDAVIYGEQEDGWDE